MGLYEVLVIGIMIALNGVFAAYELALASVRPGRLRELAERKRAGAATAVKMKERIEGSLAVVQLGITLVGATAAATGGANVAERLAPWLEEAWALSPAVAEALALAIFVIPLAAVTIIVGELAPKVFAIRNPEWVCLMLSPAMRAFSLITWPAVWVFERTTKLLVSAGGALTGGALGTREPSHFQELRAQAGVMRTSRLIGAHQERIIVQAARLSDITVGQVMVPAEDIVMLVADAPLTENFIVAHMDMHTRFPVAEDRGNPQSILGYANIKEMVFLAKTHPQNPVLREIVRPLPDLARDALLSDALARLVAAHTHLALVRDTEKRIVGLITLEDILEELVGEMPDELDRMPRHLTALGQRWIAGGGLPVGKLREVLADNAVAAGMSDETTVHDWMSNATGKRLKGGDAIEIDGLNILVRKIRRHRIAEVLIDPTPPEPPVI